MKTTRLLAFLIGSILCFSFIAYSDAKLKPGTFSITGTGVASGNDSVFQDTLQVANLMHFRNRYQFVLQVDSLPPIEGVGGGDFGDIDSITTILKSEFRGIWTTLDSVKGTMANSRFTSSLIIGPLNDTLVGENLMLIIRIADTVGLVTDSSATFRGRWHLLHAWQD